MKSKLHTRGYKTAGGSGVEGGGVALSEMYIVNFTTVNTPHISPHVSPRNVVMQGPVKFT